jgi:phage terminase small subunit
MTRKPTLTPTAIRQRPAPPKGYPFPGFWRSIVIDFAPDHFRGANLALLENLCAAYAMARQCDALIEANGLLVDGKANAAIAIRKDAWLEMRLCSTKLRLTISSTMRSDAAAARPDPKHSLKKPWL